MTSVPPPDSVAMARPLVMDAEGLRLAAYLCPAGKWTWGYGHTGPDVRPGHSITPAWADHLLDLDLHKARDGVRRVVGIQTPNREAALISFVFNLGEGAFADGHLDDLVRAGRHAEVPTKLLQYDKARVHGQLVVEPGLEARRWREGKLYAKG